MNFLEANQNFGIEIQISDETDELLDTGGGLMKARHFFDDRNSFLVCNTDIISNIDLHAMRTHHMASGAIATLAVRQRQTSRYFLFDRTMTLSGWENRKTGEKIITRNNDNLNPFAFSGIQFIHPYFFELCNKSGKFSITKAWIELSENNLIKGYRHDNDYWFDLGTPEALATAEKFFNTYSSTS
jgi:NDP-sugar pyrophosphorylase family protein